jgi:hypothetical protein
MATCTTTLEGNNTYALAVVRANGDLSLEKDHIVVGDAFDQKASCSCQQFARTDVLCGHALKFLDLMNIKLLSDHYIMKRWTREAKFRTILDNQGRSIIENPKLQAMQQYRFMSHKFLSLAYQAASDPECCMLVDTALDCLGKQLEDKISASTSVLSDSYCVQHDVEQDDDLLSVACLKKKRFNQKVQSRIEAGLRRRASSKRKRQTNLVYVYEKKCFNVLINLYLSNDKVYCFMQQPENDGSLETQVPKDDAPTGFSSFTTVIELLNVDLFSLFRLL